MEEMSKKTKRLEKENLSLTRKQEAANKNILTMAEERTTQQKEIDLLRKQKENLEKLCRGMQAQGRGQVNMVREDGEETESEYDYDDEEEDGSFEGEYEDDTEEEQLETRSRTYGPVPPPPPPPSTAQQQSASSKGYQQQPQQQQQQQMSSRAVNGVKG